MHTNIFSFLSNHTKPSFTYTACEIIIKNSSLTLFNMKGSLFQQGRHSWRCIFFGGITFSVCNQSHPWTIGRVKARAMPGCKRSTSCSGMHWLLGLDFHAMGSH